MRVLLLTKDGRHFVLDAPPVLIRDEYVGSLCVGGTVYVPAGNAAAFEVYEDRHMVQFRHRLDTLEAAARGADA